VMGNIPNIYVKGDAAKVLYFYLFIKIFFYRWYMI